MDKKLEYIVYTDSDTQVVFKSREAAQKLLTLRIKSNEFALFVEPYHNETFLIEAAWIMDPKCVSKERLNKILQSC